MNKSSQKKSYNIQFTQLHTVTDVTNNESINSNCRFYDRSFIKNAVDKANTDQKDFMSFVTHYMFVQMNAQDTSHDQMFLHEGINMFGERVI